MTISQYRTAIRNGKYAWPGGYPLFFICTDGAALCFDCAKKERRNILESIARNIDNGWKIAGADVNWEDTDLHCDHCYKQIEAAYSE